MYAHAKLSSFLILKCIFRGPESSLIDLSATPVKKVLTEFYC